MYTHVYMLQAKCEIRQCTTMPETIRQCNTLPDTTSQCITLPKIARHCATMPEMLATFLHTLPEIVFKLIQSDSRAADPLQCLLDYSSVLVAGSGCEGGCARVINSWSPVSGYKPVLDMINSNNSN